MLIAIDEHRNVWVDPTQVSSCVVIENSYNASLCVTMANGTEHRIPNYYAKSVYETHRIVLARINGDTK